MKPDGVGGTDANPFGIAGDAGRVVNGPWPSEISIGQTVQGNVHAKNLIFNVGGAVRQLTELSDAQVDRLRAETLKAIRRRQRKIDSASACAGLLLLAIWSHLPTEIVVLPPPATPLMQLSASLAVTVGLLGGLYLVYRTKVGAWARRHKATIRELESILAKVEAERDLRRGSSQSEVVEMVRKVLSVLRE
jgi:hypothetical protein